MRTILAVDPGLKGALCFMSQKGVDDWTIELHKMPLRDGDIDPYTLAAIIKHKKPDRIFIEKVHAMPGQGVTSMFTFGKGYGTLIGIFGGLGLPYRTLTPQQWQKVAHIGITGVKDPKQRSLEAAKKLYGESILIPPKCRVAHDGFVDALLIAHVGKMIL